MKQGNSIADCNKINAVLYHINVHKVLYLLQINLKNECFSIIGDPECYPKINHNNLCMFQRVENYLKLKETKGFSNKVLPLTYLKCTLDRLHRTFLCHLSLKTVSKEGNVFLKTFAAILTTLSDSLLAVAAGCEATCQDALSSALLKVDEDRNGNSHSLQRMWLVVQLYWLVVGS